METPVAESPPCTFRLRTRDGVELFVYRWLPAGQARGVVQIAHGLAEHAGRYSRLAAALNSTGYAVYAHDHRGHGRTAESLQQLGFFAAEGGWRKCLDDLWQVNRTIAAEQPSLPIVLLGHSMGSTMAAQFIADHGDSLAGVVLSGASGKPTLLALVGRLITRIERLRLGRAGHSRLVHSLTFAEFNKRFAPARTEFDWLSRDTDEVDKYVADPLCGFNASVQLWIDLLDGWVKAMSPASYSRIPGGLPVLVISGGRDPVSAGCRQIDPMISAWRKAGLQRLEYKFYPEARHEIFNESNREEVTRDVLNWLEKLETKKS
jgi:alpha-beta hydrolase superfamily lysophospholipase